MELDLNAEVIISEDGGSESDFINDDCVDKSEEEDERTKLNQSEFSKTIGCIGSGSQPSGCVNDCENKTENLVDIEGNGECNEVDNMKSKEALVEAPRVGMVFDSLEAVDAYYRSYGKQQGFGVVRAGGSVYRSKEGLKKPLRSCTWTCDRYGKPNRKKKAKGKNFVTNADGDNQNVVAVSKKIECSAMIYVSVNLEKEWEVRKAVNLHKNHAPVPSMSKYIWKYRKEELTEYMKRKLRVGASSGLSVAQLHNLIVTERNGHENVALSKRDVRNEIAREKRLKMKDGDSEAMVDYFKKMTAGNQNFYHTYRLDQTGHMQDIIWVDARCRAAYEEFGDVVCFDTTYLTNEYELPFANFVGVNHHGQTILLGCALISHETTETFQWVFSSWLNCMDGKAPIGILTDQSAAMRRALSIEMPQSRHRWCIWHITSKFGNKLGRHKKYKKMKEALLRAIYDSYTVVEFESKWQAVLDDYNLQDNLWLNGLYKDKEMWVPVFMKHYFWAGMKTTQRVESIHSFFDDFVNKHTRLYEFGKSYCKAMESRAEEERRYDAHTETYRRQVVYGFPAEHVFQRCYTDSKFKEVVRECSRTCFLHCFDKVVVSDSLVEYCFEDVVWARNKDTRKEFLTQHKRKYRVKFDSVQNFAQCECCLFESSGIMCRHIIKLLSVINVKDVPEKYILRRWRKDIQRKHTRVKVAYHDPSKNVEISAFDRMQMIFEPICHKATARKGTIDLVLELLQLMDLRVDEKIVMIDSQLGARSPASVVKTQNDELKPLCNVGDSANAVVDPPPHSSVIKDPPGRACAHRTTSQRYKPASEKVTKSRAKGNKAKEVCLDKKGKDAKTKQSRKRCKGKEVASSHEFDEDDAIDDFDAQGCIGVYKKSSRAKRNLFPESINERQGTITRRVDTELRL